MASADVEGAFDCIKHDDVEKALLQKGVDPESVCSLLRESSDLKGRINLTGAPMSPAFLYARGARQGSVEGPDMWNQVLGNALRESASRWETEVVGFKLARDYRKAQKRRRGSSGDAVKDEGRVLHHLCWADDLYAMAGTMNHLTRILEDMTNAIERLGMRWKEKSLTIVAGPFTEYKPGDVVEIISNSGIRWSWRVVEGMEALCSEASMWHRISKANSMFYAKKALFCDPKLPVKRRVDAFYSTCVPAALHGAGEWAYTQSMFQALRIILARQLKKHNQPRVQTLAMKRVRIAAWQMVSCPSDARGRRYWEESVTWRFDEIWRDETIKLSKEDYRNSTQWKRPLPGRPNYWERPFTRFLGDAWKPKPKACNTWTEWLYLTKEFERSWHVMLNLKPPESSSVCDCPVERSERPRDDSDPWNVAWPSDTHRRLEVLGDNKVVVNWMNGAWEVKGEEHAVPVRGVVDQFVRRFLGDTFRPRTDENDWSRHIFVNRTKLRTHMLIG